MIQASSIQADPIVVQIVEGALASAEAEVLWLGATKAPPGSVYFVTDGEPVLFRDFVTRLLGTQGVTPPDKSVPAGVARALATGAELVWRRLKRPGAPPLTRSERDLGYRPLKSREDGLAELA